jgi:hypothetical protein
MGCSTYPACKGTRQLDSLADYANPLVVRALLNMLDTAKLDELEQMVRDVLDSRNCKEDLSTYTPKPAKQAKPEKATPPPFPVERTASRERAPHERPLMPSPIQHPPQIAQLFSSMQETNTEDLGFDVADPSIGDIPF